jgi:hypothetical protein
MLKFWEWMEKKSYGQLDISYTMEGVEKTRPILLSHKRIVEATDQMLIGYMLEYIREHAPPKKYNFLWIYKSTYKQLKNIIKELEEKDV